ncbi:CDP-alcohol phosphatidyltransferase family protein [Paracoccus albus]|uniref:CDP-alcohol phosphatidyltransferase family protein n=1 Tax=Paracoccus albus TaxID=3017784 RepID=UPI0022F0F7A2|nr:CDP-alcohol phosphatidyltransferase family protein [Paracoccus albus]WBU62072.1 CDP-alcohol phosphatidyltransferase family protein [Paracoccus albus]
MSEPENRRPLASRQTGWANRIATWLASTRITPNQISQAGMVTALLAGACFWASGSTGGFGRELLLLAAAGFCQLRLLCNLFDGMVAVEAGRGSPDGGFWNEFPDRVSDMLILVGLGLGAAAPTLGWASAAMALLTAYIRELGLNLGQGADFSGPMAKQHRMAVVTAAALLAMFEPLWGGHSQVLRIALWIVTIGAALTALRRCWRLLVKLRG